MENGVTIQYDVADPSGEYVGVRVHNGKRGMWVGQLREKYRRETCEAAALEKFHREARSWRM